MDVEADVDWVSTINKNSCEVLPQCFGEPTLATAGPGDRFQFERLGYFARDPETVEGRPVFNRSVSLRDSWAKIEKKGN
jgi:glutaminyl-tRNA synthetase